MLSKCVSDGAVEDFITPLVLYAHTRDQVRVETVRRFERFVLRLLRALQPPHTAFSSSSAGQSTSSSEGVGVLPLHTHPSSSAAPQTRSATVTSSHHTFILLHSLRRVLLVMTVLYNHVLQGTVITQREVYYQLVRCVPHQRAVNETIQQLVRLLAVPRTALGVMAGSRGFVAGSLSYSGSAHALSRQREGVHDTVKTSTHTAKSHTCAQNYNTDEHVVVVVDDVYANEVGDASQSCCCAELCHRSSDTMAIPAVSCEERDVHVTLSSTPAEPALSSRGVVSTSSAAPSAFRLHRHTRFILVVEKYAVFHTLMREELCRKLPCVLLTSQGCPTHAARVLLHRLHRAAPHIPVVALTDYNPSGLGILMQYRFGMGAMCESAYYAIPTLRWLGPRRVHYDMNGAAASGHARRAEAVHDARLPLHGCAAQAKESVEDGEAPFGARVPHQPFTPRDRARMRTLLSYLHDRLTDATRRAPASASTSDKGDCSALTDDSSGAVRNGYLFCPLCDERHRSENYTAFEHSRHHDNDEEADGRVTCAERVRRACNRLCHTTDSNMGEDNEYGVQEFGVTVADSPPRTTLADEAAHVTSIQAWLIEATAMDAGEVKMEIESLYSECARGELSFCVHDSERASMTMTTTCRRRRCTGESFAEWVCRCLLRHDYI